MSVVTIITKYKGQYKKGIVHYAQLFLDIQKRFRSELRFAEQNIKRMQKNDPNADVSYDLERIDYLKRSLENPMVYNSGIVNERHQKRMDTVTPQNALMFVNELTPVDNKYPRYSDTGNKPLALIDFDAKIFWIDEKLNDFAHYKYTLPEGWRYKPTTWQSMEVRYKERL